MGVGGKRENVGSQHDTKKLIINEKIEISKARVLDIIIIIYLFFKTKPTLHGRNFKYISKQIKVSRRNTRQYFQVCVGLIGKKSIRYFSELQILRRVEGASINKQRF